MDVRDKLLTENPWKLMISLSLPAILGQRAGENKSKQLQDTLETFVLDAGMSSSKTAKFMQIHAAVPA